MENSYFNGIVQLHDKPLLNDGLLVPHLSHFAKFIFRLPLACAIIAVKPFLLYLISNGQNSSYKNDFGGH